MARSSGRIIVGIWVGAAAMLGGGPAAALDARPEVPLLGNATAVLSVGDGIWLDHQLVQLATSAGEDPQTFRDRLGRMLYLCGDISAIDLQRPALRAWRAGSDPLVAIVPVADRRKFIAAFGITPPGETPLVRTGDHEGTVVFTRTLLDHTEEYHLLIDDQTAYFAHTVEDCRALAASPLRLAGDDVALSYVEWGPFAGHIDLGVPLELPSPLAVAPPALTAIARLTLAHLSSALEPGIGVWKWQVHEKPSSAVLTAALEPVPDSAFARWLASAAKQPFAPGEPLPASCLARLECAPFWQGGCESFGAALTPDAKAAAGAAWTPSVEEVWHGLWSAGDGLGPLSAGLSLPSAGSPQWVAAMDAPQPDLIADQLGSLLLGWQQQSAPAAPTAHQALIGAGGASACVACDPRAVLLAFCGGEQATSVAQAAAAMPASAAPGGDPPASNGLLATLAIDATRVLRVVEAEHLDSDAALPEVRISAAAAATPESLTLRAEVPLGDLGTLLSKVSWK